MDRTATILMPVGNGPGPGDNRVRAEATALRDAGFGVSITGPEGTSAYLVEYGEALLMTCWLSCKVLLRHGFDVIHAAHPAARELALDEYVHFTVRAHTHRRGVALAA